MYTLEIPEWLMHTLNKALQELPYKEAAPAINEINRQIHAQNQADPPKVDPA
jgi:hypothetical protein